MPAGWVPSSASSPPRTSRRRAPPAALPPVERVVRDGDAYAATLPPLRALADAAKRHRPRIPIVALAWLRMEPWRELVARAFDATPRRPLLAGVASVDIGATGPASA